MPAASVCAFKAQLARTRARTHQVGAKGGKRGDAKQREHAVELDEHVVEQRVDGHGRQHVHDDVRQPAARHSDADDTHEPRHKVAQLVHHPAHLAVRALRVVDWERACG